MQNFDELKFESFWKQLSKLLLEKHDFETIDQNRKFEAKNAIQAIVVTPESTGNKRVIKYDEFVKIWRLAKKLPKEQFLKPSSYTNDTQNSSYIVTLMKTVLESDKN
jgi:hypothetical protein